MPKRKSLSARPFGLDARPTELAWVMGGSLELEAQAWPLRICNLVFENLVYQVHFLV